MSAYKKFDPSLYSANDALGRAAGYMHLMSRYAECIATNEDPYGVDLVYGGNWSYSLECEVKHSWKGGKFPFAEINIPHRKLKFFSIGASFLMLAGNLQDYLILPPEAILNSALEEQPNKYVAKDELFFKVDSSLAVFRRFAEPVTVEKFYCCSHPVLQFDIQSSNMYLCNECTGEHICPEVNRIL